MKYRIFLFILSILLLTAACTNEKKAEEDPNIILINVDDLGWSDLGFMGSAFYESPRIDALAEEAMVFMQGYAGAANCAPSRACLMTGLNTPRHHIYTVGSSERGRSKDRKVIPIPNTRRLHDSLTTLAEVLQVYGYTTCQAGKWHLSEDSRDHGFDYNIGGNQNGHPRSYYPPYQNIDLDAPENEYLTDNIMNRVLEFIESRNDKAFFLYYAPYAVHTPIQKVDSLMYRFISKPGPEGRNNPEYATMIYNLDRNIGRLIDALKQKGLYENTLIIFTSDNGGLFRISQQKPLRAGKGSYYEGGIRVPFFFCWPGKIKAGKNEDTPIVNMDIFPSILDILHLDLPGKSFDGISLAPLLLEGEKPEVRNFFWHFPVYLEKGNSDTRDRLFRTRPGSVVRSGDWKLLQYYEDGDVQLFNLKNDPGEKEDLSLANPDIVNELLLLLDQWRKDSQAPLPLEKNPAYEGN